MTTTCGGCDRPLKTPASRARGYGPVCWRRRTGAPPPRARTPPGQRQGLADVPLPGFDDLNTRKDNAMSDEITRLLDEARRLAPHVDEPSLRAVVKGVLNTLDDLIDEADDDSTWPNPGDLALLAKRI